MNRWTMLIGLSLVAVAWGIVMGGPAGSTQAASQPAPATKTTTHPTTNPDKALAARVEKAMAAAEGTCGQEAANSLRSGERIDVLPILKGEKSGNRDLARMEAQQGVALIERGPNWPRPRDVQAPQAAVAPKIDGVLDDEAWKTAATMDGVYRFNTTERLESPRTVWRVCWDANYLYFAFECDDNDVIAPTVRRDDHVYFHDCVEMFILPEFRTKAYWEIVVSPTGMIFDGLHSKKDSEFGAVNRSFLNVEGMLVGGKINGTVGKSDDVDKGYVVEVAVPWNQLPEYSRAKPEAGQVLNFMLVRLDHNARDPLLNCYAFQPLMNWGHNIWNHAKLKLVK